MARRDLGDLGDYSAERRRRRRHESYARGGIAEQRRLDVRASRALYSHRAVADGRGGDRVGVPVACTRGCRCLNTSPGQLRHSRRKRRGGEEVRRRSARDTPEMRRRTLRVAGTRARGDGCGSDLRPRPARCNCGITRYTRGAPEIRRRYLSEMRPRSRLITRPVEVRPISAKSSASDRARRCARDNTMNNTETRRRW